MNQATDRGVFVTFEGIEGSGKTTQQRMLAGKIPDAVVTKEPGGTPIADRIRSILLDSSSTIDPVAEVLLFAASRRQHTMEVIRPALHRGKVVLCDRYADSSRAYQGCGRAIDLDRLRALNSWATDATIPNLTLIFDLPVESGLDRARARNASSTQDEGRFEAEDLRFHRRVREGFLSLHEAEPKRLAVIDADGSPEEVCRRVARIVENRLPRLLP